MNADRIRVDIAESKGAPSPTAVFEDSGFDSPLRHSQRLKNAYAALRGLGHGLSKKIALISASEDGIGYRGVQVKGYEENGTPILECGRNCGNSMVAVAIVAVRRRLSGAIDKGHLRVINRDTQLVVDMEVLGGDTENGMDLDMHISSVIGRNVRSTLMNPDAMPAWTVHTDLGLIPVTTLNLVNPYIIVAAESLGVGGSNDLLGLPSNDRDFVDNLIHVRKAVIEMLAMKRDSEFPKIAAVCQSGGTIAARTLYLNGLHKGLPITGIISIAAASRLSGSLVKREEAGEESHSLLIRSPQEEVPLSFEVGNDGSISDCVIRNRYVVLKAIDVELDIPE